MKKELLMEFNYYQVANAPRNTHLLEYIDNEAYYNRWTEVECWCTDERYVYDEGLTTLLMKRRYELWGYDTNLGIFE